MGYPCSVCGTMYAHLYEAEMCHVNVKDANREKSVSREYRESPRREPVNRLRLEEGLEREQGSAPGELTGYARETGRTAIIRELLDRTGRARECAYGSGFCIVPIISGDIDSPTTGLSKCLKADQVGSTGTNHGRTKRLKRTGCMEPNYSLLSGSWKCKYADGKAHE